MDDADDMDDDYVPEDDNSTDGGDIIEEEDPGVDEGTLGNHIGHAVMGC